VRGLPRAVLELPAACGLEYDVTLHDYLAICPQFHLVDAEGRYCGEPGEAGCTACLIGRAPQWNVGIVEWRATFHELLRGAARVIAPSRDVARRIRHYMPDVAIDVWPHPEAQSRAQALVRVATLGALGREKGLDVVIACAEHAEGHGLPLAFRVLGPTGRPLPLLPAYRLSRTGEYDEADLANLIAAERPDVLWFPAQVPETWSYTLSAALATGLPIVASGLGALPERLAQHPCARLVPFDAMPQAWNEALLSVAPVHALEQRQIDAANPIDYAERYLAPLDRTKARSDGTPAIDERHFAEPPHAAPPDLTLGELVDAGVLCGKTQARDELLRRVARIDVDVAQLSGEVARLNDTVVDLDSHNERLVAALEAADRDTAAARERVSELETSTTWRVTAPVRALAHGTKLALTQSRSGWRGLRNLPHRASLAMTLLRDEGPRALAARIAHKARGGGRFRPRAPSAYRQAATIAPLAFATADAPKVSIVIPAYGKPLLTFTCLASVHEHTATGLYEVIVVDDASPESMGEALRDVSGVRFERNASNLGFVASCNRGAEVARGETLVLLNNDTIVTSGWLEALMRVLDTRPDAGLVGAKLVYPDGRLQEAGGIVWRDGSAWNVGRDDDPERPEYNYVREVDYCSGACLAIRRDVFLELGGFDARYAPAYYEDTDLAFAVRDSGRKVYYQPAATVVHFEGQTSGTDLSSGIKQHQARNRVTFRDKWAHVLATHRSNGMAPQLARDRSVRRRVLVIDACLPTPDQDSGSVRMTALLELMIDSGSKVTFVADNLEHREPYVAHLQQRGVEVLFHPYVRSVSEAIAERGRDIDIAIVSRHYVAVKHLETLRRFAPQALVAFDTVDLHFLRAERLAALDGGGAASSAARARRDEELALIRRSDVTIVVSPVERDVLHELVPDARILLVSNIHEPIAGGKPFAEREGLVFIGGFQHPPNTDGVLWYAREVLPLVRSRLPGVRTYIVGSKVPSTVRALAARDFVVTGYVPDVAPFFTSCRVSIAPLRYGAGVKGKVNLAMSYGLPVVATSPSVEGMHLRPGVDVLVADDAEAFAAAIERLYRDEALWRELAANGVANIRSHFSRDVAKRALENLFDLAAARATSR
jgi:GT2 family glycosyltransferase/glycosyltransferase involved in cell wall biosynthesis